MTAAYQVFMEGFAVFSNKTEGSGYISDVDKVIVLGTGGELGIFSVYAFSDVVLTMRGLNSPTP